MVPQLQLAPLGLIVIKNNILPLLLPHPSNMLLPEHPLFPPFSSVFPNPAWL